MNRIYWDEDKIAMLTDHLDAVKHSHWMVQLFLSLEDELQLWVADQWISGRCIVVNEKAQHAFSTQKRLHFSMLIEPTSSAALQLKAIMGSRDYCTFDGPEFEALQKFAMELPENREVSFYRRFIKELYAAFPITQEKKPYDERILELLHLISSCECSTHTISSFAERVALSPSRLSHLFREQVGIPLKSYIMLHQMERAFILLLNGACITDAAMEAGFDTPSHFAGAVKKMMGTPASLSLKDSEFLKVSEEPFHL